MRILFVAYCMINNENGDSLIGVYKRSLRIGLEMVARGHEVLVFCTGREAYRDATVREAESQMRFVDLPLEVLFCPSCEVRRRYYRKLLRQVAPDVVVVGEAPLAGTLLDAALCACGLEIPVIVLDNAYSPHLAQAFTEAHGPIADGLILTGPSSFHMPEPPPYYCAAPPFISGSSGDADGLLRELRIPSKKLAVVLGYEYKAEILASKLLAARPNQDLSAIFIVRDPAEARQRLNWLPASTLENVRCIGPPEERILFSLLSQAAVAIGKCGFMQITECLALRTPFLGIHYRGCCNVEMFDTRARQFICVSQTTEAEPHSVEAFDRFLELDGEELRPIHSGGFDGLGQVAEFIENLPATPRQQSTDEAAVSGYTPEILGAALSALHSRIDLNIRWIRCSRLRNYEQCQIDSVTASYRVSGRVKQAFLWGRRYSEERWAEYDLSLANGVSSPRRILYRSEGRLLMLEKDIGESHLPPLLI